MIDIATIFAWFVLALLFGVVVCLVVWLGSMPKKIAAKRNHPQVDAINACSWIGLAFGGVGWAIAFVWAFMRIENREASPASEGLKGAATDSELQALTQRVQRLEEQLQDTQTQE